MDRSTLFLPPEGERRDLKVVGEVIRVLADASQTGSYEVFEQHGPEGAGPPLGWGDVGEAGGRHGGTAVSACGHDRPPQREA